MAVSAGLRIGVAGGSGARAVSGSGMADTGFTDAAPPGVLYPAAPPLSSQGTTWVVAAAAAWLVFMYVHWHTY